MFTNHPRSGTSEEFGDHAVIRVVVRKLKNRGLLPRHGIFPGLADLDRCAVRWRVRVRMGHDGRLHSIRPHWVIWYQC